MPTKLLPKAAARVLLLGIIGLGLCACSNSSTPTTTTLPPLSSSTASIKHAFEVLFDLANPSLPPKLAVVQDGSSLTSAMKTALKSSLAKEAAGASVSKIAIEEGTACKNELVSSPCAKVTYEILSPAKTVLLTDTGYAVYIESRWLVAKAAICTLLDLENSGSVVAGCG